MKTIQTAIAILLLLHGAILQAQDNEASVTPTFELSYLHGDIKNPIEVPHKNNSHYLQLSVLNATGKYEDSFFSLYGKPNVGATVLFGFLGHKDVLGQVVAVYPTWQYMFYEEKNIGWNLRMGSGFAYFTKPHHKITNPDNQLIGSHLTNITEISPNVWFKFAPGLFVQTGLSFLHYSNGHTAIPNIGMNDLTVRLGLIYKPGTLVGLQPNKRKAVVQDSIWRKNISLSYGRHELAYSTYPVDGPNYNIYKVGAYISRQYNTIHEFQIGFSLAYYDSYYTFIAFEDYYTHFKRLRATQTTIHVGHEFLMNRFGFLTDVGVKVFDPFYRSFFLADESMPVKGFKSVLSSRLGFKYYPITNSFAGKKLALGMFIKTNLAQADFVEYNITYTF